MLRSNTNLARNFFDEDRLRPSTFDDETGRGREVQICNYGQKSRRIPGSEKLTFNFEANYTDLSSTVEHSATDTKHADSIAVLISTNETLGMKL